MAWSGLAVFIPVGVISALLAIRERPVESYQQPLVEALPEIVSSVQNEHVLINLRSSRQNREYQVEVVVLKPMATPSPSLFHHLEVENAPLAEHLIGALGPRGLYRFPIERERAEGNLHLMVFDVIKKEPVYRLQLKGGQHGS